MSEPSLLAELEGIIGRDAALKFTAARGGTRVYIPARVSGDHWIVKAIGAEAAFKLCAHFTFGRRGISIDIPLLPKDIIIKGLSAKGASPRQVARQLGITERTVRRHRAAQPRGK
jgi:DNA-binding NarL/FixJ family response regulator